MSGAMKVASDEVIKRRKQSAEEVAAGRGHRIGDWKFEEKTYHGHCLNEPCRATMR